MTNDAEPVSRSRFAGLKRFVWGEASLWTLFLLFAFSGASDRSEILVTVAGLFALSAIGVRATRQPGRRDD